MSDGINRRRLLAAGAGAAALGLAGCTEELENRGNSTSGDPLPPSPPSTVDIDNEVWQYVVESIEYQNEQLRRMAQE